MKNTQLRILPDKTQYVAGEMVWLEIEDFSDKKVDKITVTLFTYKGKCLEMEIPLEEKIRFALPENISQKTGGYLVKAGDCYTAFDVVNSWTEAPRYGFLSSFREEDKQKKDYQTFFREMHLNVIQFYDWMYRHDDFYSETDLYTDIMGRKGSMTAVAEKVEGVHACGAKAMAYGAVYGAETFYQKHPECRYLYDNGEPMIFIDKIWLMDIHKGTAWRKKILQEYGKALTAGFDGVHMDQYGDPKEALVWKNGELIVRDLAEDFCDLINETKEIYPEKQFIFNAVNNWPVDSVKKSREDCVYIEVWSPNDTYCDLYRLIAHARETEDGKRVILAAYLNPFKTEPEKNLDGATAQLAMATIFASGGYHLLLGEGGSILTEAYYPDHCRIGYHSIRNSFKHYYDFITAYGELLFPKDWTDVTMQYAGGINSEVSFNKVNWKPYPEADKVWIRIYKRGREYSIRYVNFSGIQDMNWNKTHALFPEEVANIETKVKFPGKVKGICTISPDDERLEPCLLNYETRIGDDKRQEITFTIKSLSVFSVVYLKME